MTPDEGATIVAVPACRVTKSSCESTAVLHIQGDLDAATAPVLRVGLTEAVGESTVLMELTGVDLIDSVGVDTLLGALLSIRGRGGRVALAGARPVIAEALRAAGVDRLVFLADTPIAGLGWLCES